MRKRKLWAAAMAAAMVMSTMTGFSALADGEDAEAVSDEDVEVMDAVIAPAPDGEDGEDGEVLDGEGALPETVAEGEFDPYGEYHATLGVQTCNTLWVCRFGYYNADINEYYDTDMFDKLYAADPSGGNATYAGTFTDAVIAGNGTYTVSLTGADFGGETTLSQIFVATDIPENWDDLICTDVKLTVNGKEIVTFDEGVWEEEDKYLAGGMCLLVMNHWRPELISTLSDLGVKEDGSGLNVLTGNGDDNISITFTISGFAYDNESATEPETTTEEVTEAPTTIVAETEKETEAVTEAITTEAVTEEATTAAAENTNTSQNNGLGAGTIAGIVVAVVAVIAIVVAFVVKKKKK